jgi:pathogenesis-related protein 1
VPDPTTANTTGYLTNPTPEEYTSIHNEYRALHGAQNLIWNDTLSAKAQQWANGCVFQHSHGSLGPFGGQLFLGIFH